MTQQPSTDKRLVWGARILTALSALGLVASAMGKFTASADIVKNFETFGYPASLLMPLGVVELTCVVLYLVPQTAVLGAVLLTGYLGGAVATHVRVGDAFIAPIIVGVLVWGGVFLRDARLRALLPLRRPE
ncbi:DoxX family protein [Myxococcota bacterium]|nr:DoxX family protein [Myxococcota bacterium]